MKICGLFFFLTFSLTAYPQDEDYEKILKKAEQGDAEAQTNLGTLYQNGKREGFGPDPTNAEKWYLKAAEQGNVNAQYSLGRLYSAPIGYYDNPTKAVEWLRKAAIKGHVLAQYYLAYFYFNGLGTDKNLEESAKWYRSAAMQGHTSSEYYLGYFYSQGIGVNKSFADAIRWYRKAAEKGHAEAQYKMGYSYYLGIGVGENRTEAASWLLKAAEQNHSAAQFGLGLQYQMGEGVIKDEVEGLAWSYDAAISDSERRLGSSFTLLAQQRAKQIQSELDQKHSVLSKDKNNSTSPAVPSDNLKATGTGVFITAEGLILTAAHVVNEASTIKVLAKTGILKARVVSIDRNNDLALLKAESGGFPVPVKSSKTVKLGQKIFTLGFPNPSLQGRNLKMTEGSISSLAGIQDDPRQWQISVPVQPGNSGGPLFDEQGNLIGVVVAKLDAIKAAKFTGDLSQNVNYAVKSAYVLPMLEPYEAKLTSEGVAKSSNQETVVEKVQDSVVLILVY
jgi:TPR repeat protein